MKKEFRVYIVDTAKMKDEILYGKRVYTASNESFIKLSEAYGTSYTLEDFSKLVSLGSLNLSTSYLRCIKPK